MQTKRSASNTKVPAGIAHLQVTTSLLSVIISKAEIVKPQTPHEVNKNLSFLFSQVDRSGKVTGVHDPAVLEARRRRTLLPSSPSRPTLHTADLPVSKTRPLLFLLFYLHRAGPRHWRCRLDFRQTEHCVWKISHHFNLLNWKQNTVCPSFLSLVGL